ncbi:MAG: hypothetical protein ABSH20_27960, partial [Tepidisphaeraceae bacterium]
LTKTGGSGTSTIGGIDFVNSATIDVESGTLQNAAGDTSTGGTFIVAQGTVLDLTGGTNVSYQGTYTGSGQGVVQISSGTFTVAGPTTLDFPGGMFQWSGGNINTSGQTLANTGVMTLSNTGTTGTVLLYGTGELANLGTIKVAGAGGLAMGIYGGNGAQPTLDNESGATFDLQSDASITAYNTGGLLTNGGTLIKTGAGTATIQGINLSNTGTVEADAGTFSLAATPAQFAGVALTGGTWAVMNGATLSVPNASSVHTNNGAITLGGAGSTFTNISGLTTNAGSLTVENDNSFSTIGNLSNNGTLTVGADSNLRVNGTFAQGTSATLAFVIAGTSASGDYGTLTSIGAATLAGTLGVSLAPNFAPSASDIYTVATYPSHTGIFSTDSVPLDLTPDVNDTDITVGLSAVAPTSSITALPASEATPSFTISWSGQPYQGGPPIAYYNIYYSDDHGPFQQLLSNTTNTSATFNGTYGHAYGFFSVVTDAGDNAQPTPTGAQAATTVAIPTIEVTPTSFSATAGRVFNGNVATFDDSDPSAVAGAITATIHWGDGNVSTGLVVENSPGSFTVGGSNTYLSGGNDTVTINVSDSSGDAGSAHESVTISSATLSEVNAATDLTAIAGIALNNVQVAIFADSGGVQPAAYYSATVAWGDGATTPGAVSISNGQIVVTASHTYQTAGGYQPVVTLNDPVSSATAAPGATISNPLSVTPAAAIGAKQGVSFTTTVASVIDANPGETAGQIGALIKWGDGNTTSGSVSGANGSFSVSGTHTYALSGGYTITVTVTDSGGNSASSSGSASVSPVADLQPVNVQAGISAATFNSAVGLTWTDQNVGDAPALGDWSDQIYFSSSPQINASSVLIATELVANTSLAVSSGLPQSAAVTLPSPQAMLSPGTYYLIVQTDAGNTVGESNLA